MVSTVHKVQKRREGNEFQRLGSNRYIHIYHPQCHPLNNYRPVGSSEQRQLAMLGRLRNDLFAALIAPITTAQRAHTPIRTGIALPIAHARTLSSFYSASMSRQQDDFKEVVNYSFYEEMFRTKVAWKNMQYIRFLLIFFLLFLDIQVRQNRCRFYFMNFIKFIFEIEYKAFIKCRHKS